MMRSVVFIILGLGLISGVVINDGDKMGIDESIVDEINNDPSSTWEASTYPDHYISQLSFTQAQRILTGTKLSKESSLPTRSYGIRSSVDIPTSFDSRDNWPNCVTMKEIRDQSACGSCWAVGAAEVMSDRYCVFGLNNNLSISASDLISCCYQCGYGCGGGYPDVAFSYWCHTGIVSSACDPYPFPSCDHHMPDSKNPCPSKEYPTPPCKESCQDGETWDSAQHFGKTAYHLAGESDIMNDIIKNGPVETAYTVYADFLAYKSGVYQHQTGGVVGGHAVKFLGWGVTSEGVKYWIVANSWNAHWGMDGIFWIIRGVDECGIESAVSAGTPQS